MSEQNGITNYSEEFQESEELFVPGVLTEYKNKITDEIICGLELKFNYINIDKLSFELDSKKIKKNNLTHISMLKYNFEEIISQLEKYFPDIEFNKFYNSPCANECVNFNYDSTYKYSIYLVLSKDDKKFEYGYDYLLNLNDENPNKYEHSKFLLDDYEYFLEEDIGSNEDIKHYLENSLFKLLTAICAINGDECKLAEILFVKLNGETMEKKQLLKSMGYFLKIINLKKKNFINLEDLCDNLQLIDNQTEKQIDLKQFKKIIKKMTDEYEMKFNIKQQNISFDIFEIFLLNNGNYNSTMLMYYRKSYQQAMNMLLESLKIIIQMINGINQRKKYISRYIEYLIEFKLDDYKNQDIFKKYSSFEKSNGTDQMDK